MGLRSVASSVSRYARKTGAGLTQGAKQVVTNTIQGAKLNAVGTAYGCYAGGKAAASKVTYSKTTARRGTVTEVAAGCVMGAVGGRTVAGFVTKNQPGFVEGFKRGWNSVK